MLAQNLWKQSLSVFNTINENITTALDRLDNIEEDDQSNHEGNENFESEPNESSKDSHSASYRKMLEEAQMSQVKLSRELGAIIAAKDAEISTLKKKLGTEDTVGTGSDKDLYDLEQLRFEKIGLQKNLNDLESTYQRSLREMNNTRGIVFANEELTSKYDRLITQYNLLRSEFEISDKQKSDTIDNLAKEYSILAADSELRQNELTTRSQALELENEILTTKMDALQFSITEFADRASNSPSLCPSPSSSDQTSLTVATSNAAIQTPGSPGPGSGLTSPNGKNMKEYHVEIVNLQYDLKQSEDEISSLKKKLKDISAEMETLRKSRDSHQNAASEASSLSSENNLLLALQEEKSLRDTLEKSLLELRNAYSNVSHDKDRLILEKTESEEAGKRLFDKNRQFLKDIDALKAQHVHDIKSHEINIEELKKLIIQNKTEEEEKLSNIETKHNQEKIHLEDQIKLLQDSLNSNKNLINELTLAKKSAGESAESDHAIAIETWKNKLDSANTELKSLTSDLETVNKNLKSRQEELKALKMNMQIFEAESASRDGDLRLCQAELEGLQMELQTCTSELQETKVKLALCEDALKASAAELASSIEGMQCMKTKFEHDLVALKAETIAQCDDMSKKAVIDAVCKCEAVAADAMASSLASQSLELSQQHRSQLAELSQDLHSKHEVAINELKLQCDINLNSLQKRLVTEHTAVLEHELYKLNAVKDEEKVSALKIASVEAEMQLNAKLAEAAQRAADIRLELERNFTKQITDLEIVIAGLRNELASVVERFEMKLQQCLNVLEEEKAREQESALASLKCEMQKIVHDAIAEKEEYLSLYQKENKLRKNIHNKLLEIQGNIRVVCRVRPILDVERRSGQDVDVTSYPSPEDLVIQRDAQTKSRFEYDRVFAPGSSQPEVFEAVQPLIVSVLDGYNICIFAYGQTGSGKTFTMEGYDGDHGVSPRAIGELFRIVETLESQWTFTLTFSILEIYNEMILDLLDNSATKDKLDIRQTPEGNTVTGLTEVIITSPEQVFQLMSQGQNNRAVGSHDMNERSSRSHSILTIVCRGKNKINGTTVFGKLNLIDLAGSERVGKTDVVGDRLKEAQNINRSLSALGDVIASLGNKKATHVPYRNSKLTFLLQDSLGGNSKVLMFVNISPAVYNVSETMCSLNFASRCRNIELGQAKKQVSNDDSSSSSSVSSKSTSSLSSATSAAPVSSSSTSSSSRKSLNPSLTSSSSNSSLSNSFPESSFSSSSSSGGFGSSSMSARKVAGPSSLSSTKK